MLPTFSSSPPIPSTRPPTNKPRPSAAENIPSTNPNSDSDSDQDSTLTPNLLKLKPALWFALGKLVDAECGRHGPRTVASARFIGALTELVWAQIELLASDLERFAAHAGRKVVGVDDVFLVARRNEGLEELLKAALKEWRAARGTGRDTDMAAKGKSKGKGRAIVLGR